MIECGGEVSARTNSCSSQQNLNYFQRDGFPNRLRFNAAYLEVFTLSEVKHVVCRYSQWATLLQVSHSELLFFSKPDQVALHLCSVR